MFFAVKVLAACFLLLWVQYLISFKNSVLPFKEYSLLAQSPWMASSGCQNDPSSYKLLGDVKIREINGNLSSERNMENIARENPTVQRGGYFSPVLCNASEIPIESVAIVIPFRDRMDHLLIFLQHMHPILTRQKLEYKIYVINQEVGEPFNRGKLINIGYKEAMKERSWRCMIMHDVDYLPLSDNNIYKCGPQPKRLMVASSVWSFKYAAPYRDLFGGVSAVKPSHFEAANGFYNEYYGWGAEDDDLAKRLIHKGMKISMLDEKEGMRVGKYQMLTHKKAKPAPDRIGKLQNAIPNMATNGLSSLNYRVIKIVEEMLYTNITVDLLRDTKS